ncbi:MAG: glycosyltransferase family 39 protein [Syntrophorhabdales bacterium]|jgi:4-amino-4-deoxy-L-arabinose transferase-like glycosyltransferase
MRALVILCLAFILFIYGLGSTRLWDPDEPRQAITAREMVERGDYVYPYLNGVPYLEKPPLYPWLIVLTARITGRINEFSSRLPSAIAATLLLLLTYFLGRRIDHEASGFLAALILATNYQFLGNARESVMDMTFAFFIGLSIVLGYLSIEKEKRSLLVLALLPCALAILTKGPAGLVLPVGVLFFYCLATGRLRRMFFPLLAGSLLSLAVASIWFFLAGKAYAREFILHQNIARYATGFDHIEPFWYYFHKLFFNFLPWSLVLPFAAWFAYRRRLWLPLIWLLFTFVFFDISKSKRAIYLLSCYPACALLVGIYLKERWYAFVEKRWTTVLLCLFGGVLIVVPMILFPAMGRVPLLRHIFGNGMILLAVIVAVLAACGLAFVVSVAKKLPERSFLALFLYLIVLGFAYHSLYMPAMDATSNSVRLLTDEMKDLPGTAAVYTYGFSSPAFIFYMGRPIRAISTPADIPPEKDAIIVIAEDKRGCADALKPLFPLPREASYEKEKYLIFVRNNGG